MSPQLGARLTTTLVVAPLLGLGALAPASAAADDGSVTVQVKIPDTGQRSDPAPTTGDDDQLPGTGGPDLGLLLTGGGLLLAGAVALRVGRRLAREDGPAPEPA